MSRTTSETETYEQDAAVGRMVRERDLAKKKLVLLHSEFGYFGKDLQKAAAALSAFISDPKAPPFNLSDYPDFPSFEQLRHVCTEKQKMEEEIRHLNLNLSAFGL